jgi:hypothetical protein
MDSITKIEQAPKRSSEASTAGSACDRSVAVLPRVSFPHSLSQRAGVGLAHAPAKSCCVDAIPVVSVKSLAMESVYNWLKSSRVKPSSGSICPRVEGFALVSQLWKAASSARASTPGRKLCAAWG